jgi:hypothetical protein
MREDLLVFEGERPAMPGTLHQLPAHIKRAAAAAPALSGFSRRAYRRRGGYLGAFSFSRAAPRTR